MGQQPAQSTLMPGLWPAGRWGVPRRQATRRGRRARSLCKAATTAKAATCWCGCSPVCAGVWQIAACAVAACHGSREDAAPHAQPDQPMRARAALWPAPAGAAAVLGSGACAELGQPRGMTAGACCRRLARALMDPSAGSPTMAECRIGHHGSGCSAQLLAPPQSPPYLGECCWLHQDVETLQSPPWRCSGTVLLRDAHGDMSWRQRLDMHPSWS